MIEARFYEKLEEKAVRCDLCGHRCRIFDGKRGICGVRENKDGTLFSLVYSKLISSAVDPIEKKPLFHFYPGSSSYSIATVGCNFRCKNCQNWEISQSPKPQRPIVGEDVSPSKIVDAARLTRCKSIAYTYSEPTIFIEYAYDTAKLAVKHNIKNVFVTNGFISEKALNEVAPVIHAANIDLKSFSEKFYRENCGAHLDVILEAIKLYKKLGIWVEITTLIIPTLNDSEDNLAQIAEFIYNISPDIPWHLSRFYPAYLLIDLPPTPIDTIRKARELGLDTGLRYVYQGNVPGEGEDTICYECGNTLIQRYGYRIMKNTLLNSRCPKCDTQIDGVWT